MTINLMLVDCSTKKDLGPFAGVISAGQTIRADVSGATFNSVVFDIAGKKTTERRPPYHAWGDWIPCPLINGSHSLTVTVLNSGTAVGCMQATLTVAPPATLQWRGGCSGFSSVDLRKAVPLWKELGWTHIRAYIEIHWDRPPGRKDADDAMEVRNAGFQPIVTFTPSAAKLPKDSTQAQEWYKRAAEVYGPALTWWGIGNEPNLAKYWAGTLKQYIDLHLEPASRVLVPLGFKTISGAISEKIADLKSLLSLGAANYVNAIGYHPYGAWAAEHIARLKEAAGLSRLPIISTEHNLHSASDNNWKANYPQAFEEGARKYTLGICYYRFAWKETPAGKHAVVTEDYRKRDPYFDVVKGLKV